MYSLSFKKNQFPHTFILPKVYLIFNNPLTAWKNWFRLVNTIMHKDVWVCWSHLVSMASYSERSNYLKAFTGSSQESNMANMRRSAQVSKQLSRPLLWLSESYKNKIKSWSLPFFSSLRAKGVTVTSQMSSTRQDVFFWENIASLLIRSKTNVWTGKVTIAF